MNAVYAIFLLVGAGILALILFQYVSLLAFIPFAIVAMVVIIGALFGWDNVMGFIRPAKKYKAWDRSKLQSEKRLGRVQYARLQIPAPNGDDSLRDREIEALILTGQIHDADEVLREKMDRYRGDPEALSRYTHYLKYLTSLRARR